MTNPSKINRGFEANVKMHEHSHTITTRGIEKKAKETWKRRKDENDEEVKKKGR